jgi:hypothetical protein
MIGKYFHTVGVPEICAIPTPGVALELIYDRKNNEARSNTLAAITAAFPHRLCLVIRSSFRSMPSPLQSGILPSGWLLLLYHQAVLYR